MALFEGYDKTSGASLNAVIEALQKMERLDCLEILKTAKEGK